MCIRDSHVERDTVQGQFRPVHPVGGPPDQNPVVVAGDALAGGIDLGLAVDFRSSRNDQLTVVPDILGDKTDDRRFDFGRVDGDDRLTGDEPSIRRIGCLLYTSTGGSTSPNHL